MSPSSPRPEPSGSTGSAPVETIVTTEAGSSETLIAVGDIASCDNETDSATAALASGLSGTIATLGDHVYPSGTAEAYAKCYGPAWGGLLERTRPAIGNHDIRADDGEAYFAYFGDRAGVAGEGWYSYELGAWHVVVLNTNCNAFGCDAGSLQHTWLVADLAASDADCTVAYGHHPHFSSGPHGNYEPMAPLWGALYDAGGDVLLAGHDHLYERFAPLLPDATPGPNGIRHFTAGTGGYSHYETEAVAPNSELIIDDAFGVLELTLRADAFDWRFVTLDGVAADSGSAQCR